MKIGKQKTTGYRFSEDREEERKKKKKNGRRAAEGGDRRRTRIDHRLEQRSSSEASTHVACKPGRIAMRAEPTGPGRAGRPATVQNWARMVGACSLRLAPSRARGHALQRAAGRVSARGTANLARLFSVFLIFVPAPVLILFLRG